MSLGVLKVIFSLLCALGLVLMAYSQATKKPNRNKICVRLAFILMCSWAVFTFIESLLFLWAVGETLISVPLCVVSTSNLVFYCLGVILSFKDYFDIEIEGSKEEI